MKLLGTIFSRWRLVGVTVALAGCLWAAALPALAGEEPKITMQDVLKEIGKMRQELRELKIQRDRDQAVIEELRRIVEDGLPDLPMEGPQPAVAAPAGKARAAASRAAAAASR